MEDRLVAQCVLGCGERRQRLVLHLDELGRVARELARRGDDRRDRFADVAHAADGERVVLDVGAGLHGQLEERIRENRDLVAGQCAVHAAQLDGLRHVDGHDLRVRVRRADEMHVAHAVPLHVVEEDALALHEALVLLARDVRAREAGFRLARRDDERLRLRLGLRHCFTALTLRGGTHGSPTIPLLLACVVASRSWAPAGPSPAPPAPGSSTGVTLRPQRRL